MEKKFIIWDAKDGRPSQNDSGEITSEGIVGIVGEENAFLSIYAQWAVDKFGAISTIRDGVRKFPATHRELGVGDFTWAKFSLSGSKGVYQVWRTS